MTRATTFLLASWQKGRRYLLKHLYDDKDIMIREFGMKGYKVIKKLMEKLEKREISLEMQEDLLVLEKERNLALETSLAKANEKVDELAKELSLANDSIKEKMIDIAKANSSIDSLKDANVTLQENLSCLEGRYKDLEVQFSSLWESNSSLPKKPLTLMFPLVKVAIDALIMIWILVKL